MISREAIEHRTHRFCVDTIGERLAVLVCLPWLEGRSDLELDAELASVDALARLAAVDTTAGAEPT